MYFPIFLSVSPISPGLTGLLPHKCPGYSQIQVWLEVPVQAPQTNTSQFLKSMKVALSYLHVPYYRIIYLGGPFIILQHWIFKTDLNFTIYY
jgi:hypothetical protein